MGFLFFILYDRFKIVLPGSLWLVAFSELFSLIKWFLTGSNLNLIGSAFLRVLHCQILNINSKSSDFLIRFLYVGSNVEECLHFVYFLISFTARSSNG